MKTELEEAAEIHSKKMWGVYYDDIHPDIAITQTQGEISVCDFIDGAKWQAERSFTLEQIDELFFNDKGGYFDDFLDYRLGLNGNQGKNKITFKKWFNTIKK